MDIGKQWKLVFHFPLPLAVIAITTFGAVVAPHVSIERIIITYLLIFTGLVLGAYALDALASDWKPLIKDIKQWQLLSVASVGMVSFIGIVIWQIISISLYLIIPSVVIALSLVCYNLEIPKWFHNKWGFSVSWGGFIASASYYYQSLQLTWIVVPLFLVGMLIALQEWYTTNTKSPMQQYIGHIDRNMPERRLLRKETFKSTSLMCYSTFLLAMTLLAWRLI